VNRPLLVAHRAGNDLAGLRRASDAGADLIELDVHLRRGSLEVRHLKAAGPLPFLWDRWELQRRRVPLLLADVLHEASPDAELMLDLKGVDPRMARAASRALAEHGRARRIVVCSRDWRTAERVAAERVRHIFSAGNRLQLAALRRRLWGRTVPDGVAVHRRLLDAAVVEELRSAVPLVLSWPVATQRDGDLLSRMGVNGLICGDLRLITMRPFAPAAAL
jgi:glycerophosphoryl diester phosphodiesterase